jgi:Tfp pilus assembly protein FimT
VGFNPFREHDKSTLDIMLVVIALLAIVAVISWAIFGG